MTQLDGSGEQGGRGSLPLWGVVVLIVTAALSTVGWFIDRAADHAPQASAPKGFIVARVVVVPLDAVPAIVVAVTGPIDLLLDIGPAIMRPGLPSGIRRSNAPTLPVGRTPVRVSPIGNASATNCHAAQAQQLAASVIEPGDAVLVRAVEETAAGFTVNVWRPDGTDVATQLIAAGVAPMWIGPGGVVSERQSAAMQAAQADHRGIWAPCPRSR